MFEKSTEFLDMIKSVSDRMGLTSLLNLGFRLNPHLYIFLNFLNVFYCNEYTGDIDLIYSMCSFDKAWRPKDLSPWCAVFNEEDLQVNQ
jgi:multiple inositol-polyphosphate phosphatase/2,3-bisphosphoglycerate 3-phosphatase